MQPPAPFPVALRSRVPGNTSCRVEVLADTGRRVVLVRVDPSKRRGALSSRDSATIAEGARMALAQSLPLVLMLASAGADLDEGVASLHGWGRAAHAVAACSGVVPVFCVVYGLAVSGPALLLGLADFVVTTPQAVAYVSGPAAVAQLTGLRLSPEDLGGAEVHARSTGVGACGASDPGEALEVVAQVLSYLPDQADRAAPWEPSDDPPDRLTPELAELLPPTATGSYDVRKVIAAIGDEGEYLEIRPRWASQLVTAFTRVGGRAVGVVANQPQSMAGTLDIAASQKAARFVSLCDSFNVALLTLVDTPGFMPGKDLEWRGMIRHGAQLVHAYATATVPRVCLIMRKAYGGAYIVMDSKMMGNDLCLAWPSAEVAVMGAEGAVQILHRRAGATEREALIEAYRDRYLNPYVAAERGFIDQVIDPGETRSIVARSLEALSSKRERLVTRKHDNGPL